VSDFCTRQPGHLCFHKAYRDGWRAAFGGVELCGLKWPVSVDIFLEIDTLQYSVSGKLYYIAYDIA
jgi:hypothetical protein